MDFPLENFETRTRRNSIFQSTWSSASSSAIFLLFKEPPPQEKCLDEANKHKVWSKIMDDEIAMIEKIKHDNLFIV